METKMNNHQPRRDSDIILSNISQKELLFKFLIIGDYGVGKTAIVRRYTEGKFSSNYKITIGADFAIKTLDWDPHTKINLQLWDIAGHERFGYMTRVYYKYALAAALVFDISRVATFQSVKKWLTDLREKITLPDGSSIPIVLLANKCDIQHAAISNEQIVKFCKENSIGSWYITSAKENVNIGVSSAYVCLVWEWMPGAAPMKARVGGVIDFRPYHLKRASRYNKDSNLYSRSDALPGGKRTEDKSRGRNSRFDKTA